MSQDLQYKYVTGFDRNIKRTVEVKGGKLRSTVQLATGDLYREEGVYEFMTGGGLPAKKTNRFGDSPVSEADYTRRRVTRSDYEDGQFMDESDIIRMATDIKAQKLDVMLQKFKRNEDIRIQQAALGTAQGGDNGQTSKSFTAGNIIGVTLGAASGFTNAGFTYEKLITMITKFGTNNVDIESKTPTVQISWQQLNDMMQDDKFINFDYSRVGPIDRNVGLMIPNYLGCNFIVSNIIPFMNTAGTGFRIADTDITDATGTWADTDSVDVRACIATVNDAVLLEINPDIKTNIAQRSDKSFNWYAYCMMSLGAVRLEEEKVIVIPCDESPV